MIWNPAAETMNPDERRARQLDSFRKLVKTVYERVPFYRGKLDAAGFRPEDLRTLEDVSRLPFTTKDELRETYPFKLLAAPREEIVEIHTSSGTTGTPVLGAYTKADIDLWSESMARTLALAGADRGDMVHNAFGYGLFTGGLGVHYGARKMGLSVVPISSGNTKRQIMIMRDFRATILACTPSYSLYLAEVAREEGITPGDLALKAGIFGAEPWSDTMRVEIEKSLGIKAHDIYGLTEIIGPGVSAECGTQDGRHVNEDLFYPEIIDPKTGSVLPDGSRGDLVLTTLTREGTPLLRYRTRDITYLTRGACPCGRTTVRMHRLLGRTDDMLIIRGVNVFPSQIEQVLMRIEGTEPHYQIIVDRGRANLDELEVDVEVREDVFSDETRVLEGLRDTIEDALKSSLGIHARVRLVEPKSITRSEGKAKRVIDKRVL